MHTRICMSILVNNRHGLSRCQAGFNLDYFLYPEFQSKNEGGLSYKLHVHLVVGASFHIFDMNECTQCFNMGYIIFQSFPRSASRSLHFGCLTSHACCHFVAITALNTIFKIQQFAWSKLHPKIIQMKTVSQYRVPATLWH